MKIKILLLIMIFPLQLIAQGNKKSVEACAPMINGKVCYTDVVEKKGYRKGEIFNAINKWAVKNYGRDVFLSNVSSNKSRGTILVSSKVEMLLNETDKTLIKFKLYITCINNEYSIEAKDISYQYDPDDNKRAKTYPAESVIANNGKGNTVEEIKDPVLFCNATYYLMQNLFKEVREAAELVEKNS